MVEIKKEVKWFSDVYVTFSLFIYVQRTKKKYCDVFELRKEVVIDVELKRRRVLTVLIVAAAIKTV